MIVFILWNGYVSSKIQRVFCTIWIFASMASVRTPLFIWECPTPESFNSHKNSKPGKCTYKTHSVYLYVHFPEQYFAHACWDYPKPLLAGENDFHLFAVSAPKNPVLFLLFFLKKSCHSGTTFYRYNFVVFFHCIDVFRTGGLRSRTLDHPSSSWKLFAFIFIFAVAVL